MVDAQGKPYQNQSTGVSSIQSDIAALYLNY
jgi:hypothetical protein